MAIKVIKLNRSAHNEAEILKNFDHPNVVKFLASIPIDDAKLGIVMELCSFSLSDELEIFKKGLPRTRLFRLVNDFTNGFAHIRDKNIAHLDLKPPNILVGSDYNYKIADFGTAKIVKDDDYTTHACGTYSYCHPLMFEILFLGTHMAKENSSISPIPTHCWPLVYRRYFISSSNGKTAISSQIWFKHVEDHEIKAKTFNQCIRRWKRFQLLRWHPWKRSRCKIHQRFEATSYSSSSSNYSKHSYVNFLKLHS